MVQFKKMCLLMLTLVLASLVFTGNACAKESFNESITEGDGYQINNFVIDVEEIFVDHDSATFHVYNKGEVIDKDGYFVSEDSSFTFEMEGTEVEVTLIKVTSGGILPQAQILITIEDEDIININDEINGGHKEAKYYGTPSLEVTKTVTPLNAKIGDTLTVTISVENKGDDRATNVVISDSLPAKFTLNKYVLEERGPTALESYSSRPFMVYEIKATESGTFTLNPTSVTFSDEIENNYPKAYSASPTVTVEGSKKVAELEFATSIESNSVKRNDEVEVTINIKNEGDSYANGVALIIHIPEGIEYKGSSSNIEIINGMPKVYLESFGLNQEKEIKFLIKPKELGTYTITTDYSYQYEDGVSPDPQEMEGEFTTSTIDVARGDLDSVIEQPWYIIAIPLLIIIAIAGWLFHRSRQYRF
ncbi:DUF11 domain-containing protein [Methanococcoides sp. SA1]|nr:DUF11 domain-containing protein [Methanococcoides sp. SA1]